MHACIEPATAACGLTSATPTAIGRSPTTSPDEWVLVALKFWWCPEPELRLEWVECCGVTECAASACVRKKRADRRCIGMRCSSACVRTCSSWPVPITASLTLFSACMVAVLLQKKEGYRVLLAESGLSRVLCRVEKKWKLLGSDCCESLALAGAENAIFALNPRIRHSTQSTSRHLPRHDRNASLELEKSNCPLPRE